MNGADGLIATLFDAGVEVCFANPGTSEMQLVAAIDRHPRMRAVLCLFEGVATGAADGYGRMAGKPAATLLHLGPGLGNGLANLHNARRARSPVVNIVGDHATGHLKYDAPLTSDIAGIAAPVSGWVRKSSSVDGLAADGAAAVHPITVILKPLQRTARESGDRDRRRLIKCTIAGSLRLRPVNVTAPTYRCTISTRRFSARPSSLSFVLRGDSGPTP